MDLRAAAGLVRPFTMLAPATGVLFASGAAAARLGVPYDPLRVGLAVLAAACANAASNAWNQAYDAECGFSPDGRSIVYCSTASGDAEIWVMRSMSTRPHYGSIWLTAIGCCASTCRRQSSPRQISNSM